MRNALVVFVAAILIVACSKKGGDGDMAGEAPTASAAAPADPFTGELSEVVLKEAKDKIKPRMAWSEAEPLLIGTVGKATAVIDGRHYWAFIDGDKCYNLVVENREGMVGIVNFGSTDKMMKKMFAKCERGTGAVPDEADKEEDARADAEPNPSEGDGADALGGMASGGEAKGGAPGGPPKAKRRKTQRSAETKSAPDGEDEDLIKDPAKLGE